MLMNITDNPFINTPLKIDGYTIEPTAKCWITTYLNDTIIERIHPYEPRSKDTPLNLIQYLQQDPDILVTQPNGAFHYKLNLDISKYTFDTTYQILVECGTSSCNMKEFTPGPIRVYPIEILGLNTLYGLASNTKYLFNLVITMILLLIIVTPIYLYLKKRI